MPLAATLAQHIRQVYTGGNWTTVNLRDTLAGIDFATATAERPGFNSVARLTLHIDYYVDVILTALRDGTLGGRDADSWQLPLPQNPEAWSALKTEVLAKAERLATYVETLDDETLEGPFVDGKYGTVLRQLLGFTEHTHYHLGQIVILARAQARDLAALRVSIAVLAYKTSRSPG